MGPAGARPGQACHVVIVWGPRPLENCPAAGGGGRGSKDAPLHDQWPATDSASEFPTLQFSDRCTAVNCQNKRSEMCQQQELFSVGISGCLCL